MAPIPSAKPAWHPRLCVRLYPFSRSPFGSRPGRPARQREWRQPGSGGTSGSPQGAERRDPRRGGRAGALRTCRTAPPAACRRGAGEGGSGSGGQGPGGAAGRPGCADVTGRAIRAGALKTGAQRRCCSAPSRAAGGSRERSRPPQRPARAAPGPRRGGRTRQGPGALLLGGPAPPAPAEPQKPAGAAPGAPCPQPGPTSRPLPGHQGHLLGRRSPVLAVVLLQPAAGAPPSQGPAQLQPCAPSVRAGRQDAACRDCSDPGLSELPSNLSVFTSTCGKCPGSASEASRGGRQAGLSPVFGALRLPRAVVLGCQGRLARRVWAP